MKPGLHPKTLAQKMKVNATRWMNPKGKTVEQIMDTIIMEQLISTLNWVMEHKSSNLEGAVVLLEGYIEADKTWQGKPVTQTERLRSREKMAETPAHVAA